jgi:cation diffusion facilitator family transporter
MTAAAAEHSQPATPSPSAKSRRAADRRALQVTVAMYLGIFAMKVAAYLVTGVMALLAEALHTLSDLFVSGFLLIALHVASRAPDPEHRFGHGRAENVAALVAATLFISFTSYQLYTEAIPALFSSEPAEYSNLWLAVGVLLVSAAAAAVPLVSLLRRRERGAAARAQTQELINDQLGLAAALIGTVLLAAGIPIADPISTIVVATVIAYEAVKLFRTNFSQLLGRSPDPKYLDRLRSTAQSVTGVLDVTDVRAEYVGPEQLHAGIHLTVASETTVAEGEQIIAEVRRRVHEDITEAAHCVIELEPPKPPQSAQPLPGTIPAVELR